jgi:hypothetical protein
MHLLSLQKNRELYKKWRKVALFSWGERVAGNIQNLRGKHQM